MTESLPLIIRATTLRYLLMCERRVWLDAHGDPNQRDELSPIQVARLNRGVDHEARIHEATTPSMTYVPISTWAEGVQHTRELMAKGVEEIISAYFEAPLSLPGLDIPVILRGKVDRLRKHRRVYTSPDMPPVYYPIEVKQYAKPDKDDFLQLDFYIWLLTQAQGVEPPYGEFWLGMNPYNNQPAQRLRHEYDEQRLMHEIENAVHILSRTVEPSVMIARHCTECHWVSLCRTKPEKRHDISVLAGLRRDSDAHLRQSGIHTIEDFVQFQPNDLRKFKGIKSTAESFHAHARAWAEQNPVWINPMPDLLHQGGWMFDLETYHNWDADTDDVWSIGWGDIHGNTWIAVVAPIYAGEIISVTDDIIIHPVEDTDAAWRLMAEHVTQNDTPIYHWTGYDQGVMRNSAPDDVIDALDSRLHDLHHTTNRIVRFPVTSTSIKSIAAYLGFNWAVYADYLQAYRDYCAWLATGEIAPILKSAQYQADDVKALAVVWRYMVENA